jgi:hypothetical protein
MQPVHIIDAISPARPPHMHPMQGPSRNVRAMHHPDQAPRQALQDDHGPHALTAAHPLKGRLEVVEGDP